jgi:glycosyltransferase involved in cell wall biosynthesis
MFRSLVSNLLGKAAASRQSPPAQQGQNSSGAVVFVASIGEPVRITSQMHLYSDHASLRLRAFAPMLRLAASRLVHLVPPAYLAAHPNLETLQPVSTLVVTKFSTTEVCAAPQTFDELIATLARLRGRARLFADFCDNYAAIGDALRLPVLRRYQDGLAEHCILTVPCAALAEELAPIAEHGVETIEDPFESPRSGVPRASFGDPVRICWFGSLGTTNADTIVQGLDSALGGFSERTVHLDFVTHEARESLAGVIGARLRAGRPRLVFRFVPWSLEATWRAIDECDLVVLPQDHRDGWGRVKSHNRLVEAIRGGRLAIASPIASYLELADYAWVGEDLGAGVAWALANPEEAAGRVRAGQPYVEARFSPERITDRWERLLLGRA